MKRIFLVRHGESEGNLDKSVYFNCPDSEIGLTAKGMHDAVNASNTICEIIRKFGLSSRCQPTNKTYFNLAHSTYKRAKQTADIIISTMAKSSTCSIQQVITSPLCKEREWGDLRAVVNTGQKTDNLFNFYHKPLNGESFCDVYTRAAIFHQWLSNSSNGSGNIIVVAHGEFNKVYLMHLLNWDVEEFNKWGNSKNGEVLLVENGELSSITPLTKNKYFNG